MCFVFVFFESFEFFFWRVKKRAKQKAAFFSVCYFYRFFLYLQLGLFRRRRRLGGPGDDDGRGSFSSEAAALTGGGWWRAGRGRRKKSRAKR